MKIIKNTCYGGYGLSIEAKIEIAKRKGKEIYFFDIKKNPLTHKQALENGDIIIFDYTVPNPYELGIDKPDADGLYKTANELSDELSIDFDNRTDQDIITVVESLGEKANSRFSDLTIVEIPDGTEYEISEYDGLETIREVHKTW